MGKLQFTGTKRILVFCVLNYLEWCFIMKNAKNLVRKALFNDF